MICPQFASRWRPIRFTFWHTVVQTFSFLLSTQAQPPNHSHLPHHCLRTPSPRTWSPFHHVRRLLPLITRIGGVSFCFSCPFCAFLIFWPVSPLLIRRLHCSFSFSLMRSPVRRVTCLSLSCRRSLLVDILDLNISKW